MKRKLFAALCVALGFAVAPASASPILVGNAGFEVPDTTTWNYNVIDSWTVSTPGGAGLFQADSYPAAGTGFIAGVGGQQSAWINSGSISWVSGTDLLAAGVYTLTVRVGDRADVPTPLGYSLGLLGGSTLVGSVASPVTTVNDSWITASLVTTVLPGDANIGTALGIRLGLNGPLQVNFDDVALDFQPAVVPEPATLTLLGIGLVGLGRAWRKRRQ